MKKRNQSQLAGAAGISPGYLSEILSGAKRPSWMVAKRLAALLSADPIIFMESDVDKMQRAILEYQLATMGGGAID